MPGIGLNVPAGQLEHVEVLNILLDLYWPGGQMMAGEGILVHWAEPSGDVVPAAQFVHDDAPTPE